MAGDWIKMRGSIIRSPRLIAMARWLGEQPDFRAAVLPGGPRNGEFLVGDGGLRAVTVAALLSVWSEARQHGKFVGDDLILGGLEAGDLDAMAGFPAVGWAMIEVGWATEQRDTDGNVISVTLPNFKEYNAEPMTDAERQRRYKVRKKQQPTPEVTGESRAVTLSHDSRGEERRGESSLVEWSGSGECKEAGGGSTDPPARSPQGGGVDPLPPKRAVNEAWDKFIRLANKEPKLPEDRRIVQKGINLEWSGQIQPGTMRRIAEEIRNNDVGWAYVTATVIGQLKDGGDSAPGKTLSKVKLRKSKKDA